ncbi:unnamed protein product [Rotaria sp. Silwood2]|nr:unnamed protein product [Rotaria sp. Silwood2]CAF4315906.1 unnamed protein product [Rotaria sp. Silwood2]
MNLFVNRLNFLWEEGQGESEEKCNKDRRAESKDTSNSPGLKQSSRTDVCNLYWDYSKDIDNVYFMGKKIEGAYPSSFQSIGNGYAKDSYGVFYMGIKIEGTRPSSFQFIDGGYTNDYDNAYCIGKQ